MEQRDNKRALCAGTNYEPLTIQTALTYNLIDKDNNNDNNDHGLHPVKYRWFASQLKFVSVVI